MTRYNLGLNLSLLPGDVNVLGVRELLINVLIILLSILVSSPFTNKKSEQFWSSVLYSLATILCMSFPFQVCSGLFYDLRIIPLLIAVFYGGYQTGLIVTAVFFVYRMYLGGVGLQYTLYLYSAVLAVSFYLSRRFQSYSKFKKILVLMSLDLLLAITGILLSFYIKNSYNLPIFIPVEFMFTYLVLNALGMWMSAYVIETRNERNQDRMKVDHLAYHDSLTDLPNRTLFFSELENAIIHAEKNNQILAVMYLDLDRFKYVNDTFGHHVGDELIQKFSMRVVNCIRDTDLVARMGGDEFTLLLKDIKSTDYALNVARRIIRSFEEPITLKNQEFYVTTSIGIAFFPKDGTDAQTLVKNADTAMYKAKEKGRNHFQLYESTLTQNVSKKLILESSFRKALEQNQFFLLYQPKADIYSNRIIGVEALLRWKHPELGEVPPAEFITLAEETGFIHSIGKWVLYTACLQNKSWQDQGLPQIPIAVNLSMYQFQRDDLVGTIQSVLKQTGLDPQWLELEITESAIMKNPEEGAKKIKQMKELGIHLSIDDFGTGYSSLISLKRFPVDTLKIDQSFIRELTTDPKDAAITRAIIALGHSLHLKVIAEGVENEKQLAFLRKQDCHALQGYLFSRPLTAHEFEQLLKDHMNRNVLIHENPLIEA
jgi:diguanylate cyclase (GGDEF)-like protein